MFSPEKGRKLDENQYSNKYKTFPFSTFRCWENAQNPSHESSKLLAQQKKVQSLLNFEIA